jgi:hypothetical protein
MLKEQIVKNIISHKNKGDNILHNQILLFFFYDAIGI